MSMHRQTSGCCTFLVVLYFDLSRLRALLVDHPRKCLRCILSPFGEAHAFRIDDVEDEAGR